MASALQLRCCGAVRFTSLKLTWQHACTRCPRKHNEVQLSFSVKASARLRSYVLTQNNRLVPQAEEAADQARRISDEQ